MRAQGAADRAGRLAEARRLSAMLTALDRLPKPLIARIQGNVYGGGVGLLAVCDVAVAAEGVRAFPATHFTDGGTGAQDLAKGVLAAMDEPSPYTFSFTYPDDLSLTAKVEAIATRPRD